MDATTNARVDAKYNASVDARINARTAKEEAVSSEAELDRLFSYRAAQQHPVFPI
jgi:hypothetical protein